MQERLNVKVLVDIRTPEGEAFSTTSVEWFDMPMESVLTVEELLIKALGDLNSVGKAQVEQFKRGKPG